MYMFARQSRPMRDEIDRMLELDPGHPLSHMMDGLWQLLEGKASASVASLEKASELAGRPAWLLGWLGLACGAAGRHDAARALLAELQTFSATRYVSPFALALISLGLADIEGMFQWMDRAIDVSDPFIVPLQSYPFLDPFRSDPRYVSLLAKMNFTSGPDRRRVTRH